MTGLSGTMEERATERRWAARFLLVFTAIAVLAGLVVPTAVSTEAAGASAADGRTDQCRSGYSCTAYTGYTGQGASGYYAGHNCTLYAAYRLAQNGYADPSGLGNANTWDDYAASGARKHGPAKPKVTVDKTPAVGAIAQTDAGTDGHVMYVESVGPGSITVSEDSFGGVTAIVEISRTGTYYQSLNFLHFADLEGKVLVNTDDGTARGQVVNNKLRVPKDAPSQFALSYATPDRPRVAMLRAEIDKVTVSGTKLKASIDKVIARASDRPDPKPSFAFHHGQRYAIQDGQTYQYLEHTKGYRAVDAPLAAITGAAPDGGTEPRRLYAPNYAGKVLRTADLKTTVFVGGDGRRVSIPSVQLLACAQHKDKREVLGGFTATQIQSIPDAKASYSCSFNGTMLRGDQPTNPRPSWVFRDNKKWAITDAWTYDYYKRQGWPVLDVPSSLVNEALPGTGSETPKMDPASINAGSLISGQGVDYIVEVVNGQKVKRRIPYIQDNVCWRRKVGIPIVATGLTADQLKAFPDGAPNPCIIGPAVVKSDNGKSYVVDGTNTKREIPDTESFGAYLRENGGRVYGPWPATDVSYLPGSDRLPQKLDFANYANNIICREDNVCWVVDGSGFRHHIPTFVDDVCFRWAQGKRVLRRGIPGSLVETLPEQGAWTCSMNGFLMATNEGHSYYMEGNTRRPIVDQWDFNCLAIGRPVIRGIGDAEANHLGGGGAMGMQSCNGARMVSFRSTANGKTVAAEFGYGGADYAMLRARSNGVSGAYEQFRLIGDCNSGCYIQSAFNRSFVSAEAGYQGYAWGEMRSRAGSPGGYEVFRLIGDCATGCGILANANGRYVATEMDFTGAGAAMLRARSTSIGGWERFVIQ